MNRYLRDRARRKMDMRRYRDREEMYDMRNPYGSKGGYVSSSKRMDRMNMPYEGREYGYDDPDYRYDRHYGAKPEMGYEKYRGESSEPIEFYGGYAIGRMRRDYHHGENYEEMEEENYKRDLHDWIEKLKRRDKYGMTKEQVVQEARSLGADFKNYSEDELYAMYLSSASDYKDITNDPIVFIRMAIDFLKDDDVERMGSEKICAYLYSIVRGEND